MGLRTPSKSYGPGQPVGLICDLGIMLQSHETYGWSRAHRTWEAVQACGPLGISYEIIHIRRAWSHAYRLSTGFCVLYASDLNNMCMPLMRP